MSLVDEPRLYEDENGKAPAGTEQRLRVSLKGGNGPLSGIDWKGHSKVTNGENVTYTFYADAAKTELLATGVLTYTDAALNDLIGSVWTYT